MRMIYKLTTHGPTVPNLAQVPFGQNQLRADAIKQKHELYCWNQKEGLE